MGLLDGKVALVTGAGGGIGRCHALLLAAEGARVVVNDLGVHRDGTEGGEKRMADAVVDEIRAAGGEAVANYDSVADAESAANMVQQAVDTFGKLDILIANAGILRDKSFRNMSQEMWDAVIAVHLQGTYLTVREAYRLMLAQGHGGRIIMTSSTSGLFGNFGQANYGAAKAGIAGFMRCLAPEAGRKGITVNVLAPGALTRMTEDLAWFSGPEGVGNEMRAEQISPTIIWLCSDEAQPINGRVFLIYGNTVKLVEPSTVDVALKEGSKPWSPTEVGKHILEVVADRPHPKWIEAK